MDGRAAGITIPAETGGPVVTRKTGRAATGRNNPANLLHFSNHKKRAPPQRGALFLFLRAAHVESLQNNKSLRNS
jgi:hypothetical protein